MFHRKPGVDGLLTVLFLTKWKKHSANRRLGYVNKHGSSHYISMECEKKSKLITAGLKWSFIAYLTLKQTRERNWKH